MIETQLNIFDMVVISILLLSCVFAFFRGFVREVLSLGAWVGAGLVTVYYFPQAAEVLQPHFKNPMVAAGFGTLGLYVGALIFFSIINSLIFKFVKSGSDVGVLDNMLGLVFGALRGAMIVSLGYFLISMAIPDTKKPPVWLEHSLTKPYAEAGADILKGMAPGYMHEISTFQKQAADEVQKKKDKDAENNDDSAIVNNSHSSSESEKKFDELLSKMSKTP